ncbi:S8 family peptidase [Lacisediminimonas sp.]|uniref:S8 family peptidase n=1 Tax=Lacisediminimonas sp. TaxID=3060582 RepID=UPI002720D222|nr:S8 family serine peptidase [Lacisediminimonas sp.]MDO8299008.1 S8 family serine peptidase [Lacisediminimonas sp.]
MKVRQALLALAAGLCAAVPVQAGLSIAPAPAHAVAAAPAAAAPANAAAGQELVYSLIIKPSRRRGGKLDAALKASDAGALEHAARVRLRVARRMSGGSHVIRLPHAMTLPEARAIAARLMQEDSIALAEPDRIMRPATLTPDDPSYGSMQWNLMAPAGLNRGGANLPEAWGVTTGNPLVTVAVLDTGYLQHADLAGALPGYDFLGASSYMNGVTVGNGDGDGRDSDAGDPGTASAAGECGDGGPAYRSSWHGAHVAGIIAATMNNGRGGVGVAPTARLLPVRVLGRCGGPTSDIVDGMRWAAGVYSIPGVGPNPNPARVLNMSLGSSGNCSAVFQSAVTDVVNAGKLVVVAAGNNGAGVGQPANCSGAIAVTAHAVDGDLADYANIGSQVTISAPGGGCGRRASACLSTYSENGAGIFSLSNRGTGSPQPSPAGDSYALMTGTSMAAPHVTGVIALMLSVDPALTRSQLVSYLRASARPFPAASTCAQAGYAGSCGAGLLDAAAALSIIAPNIAVSSNLLVVPPHTYVPLVASVTAPAGRSIVSTIWAALPGNPATVTIDNAASVNAGFNAPQTGSYGFILTALDSAGKTASEIVTVRVNSPPVISALGLQQGTAGSRLAFRLFALDKDGDQPVFHALDLPPGATLSPDGNFEWDDSSPGTYSITFYASDNDATSRPDTVALSVTGGTGGGAMDATALLALALLAGGLRLCRTLALRRQCAPPA